MAARFRRRVRGDRRISAADPVGSEEGHLSVDGDPQGCASVRGGVTDAGYAQPLASRTRQPLQTILDMTKDKKQVDEKDKIPLMPGVEYTGGNIAETADTLRGCAK